MASTSSPPLDLPSVGHGYRENPPVDYFKFHLFYDVLTQRALDPIQTPLLAFPRSLRGVADFEYWTGRDLDRFTDETAWYYTKADIPTTDARTVAVLGPTNLDWVASVFGLSKAGFTILALSPRLSYQAIVKLMEETGCVCLIYQDSAQLLPIVDQVKNAMTATTLPLVGRHEYDKAEQGSPSFIREVDVMKETQRYAVILHSSGSTGLPKPIFVSHAKFGEPCDIGPGVRDLVTLPLFHSFPIRVCAARMFERKTSFFLNSKLPVTCESMITAIKEVRPGTLCVVPYTLKLLREKESGIEALKSCAQVLFTGSQCPDELGDYLVDRGVNLASLVGSTECGYVGASLGRSPDDKTWNYIRVPPPLMKHIWPKPLSEHTFEFVYLKDHPGRIVSNSDDPPESFHSKDIFSPHKTILNAWKYIGRLDDRVNLVNGEKVLPLPIEGWIRQAPLVKEAVVFGVGKSFPGILLFRASAAKGMTDHDFVSSVWPEIEAANRLAEGFSRIGKHMVVPMPPDIEIPTTDKGSVIRAQVYKMFEREIENAYTSLEDHSEGISKLDLQGLERYVMELSQQVVGPQVQGLNDDLFTLGMDSLQAIQIRGIIVKSLDLGGNGNKLSQNAVFEQGNLRNLAKHLNDLQLNQQAVTERPIEAMKDLVTKYSVIGGEDPFPSSIDTPNKYTIVLTGATGGLGAHLLVRLLEHPNVDKVYCLLRGDKPYLRLQKSMEKRHLIMNDEEKLRALTSDFAQPQLGVEGSTYESLLLETTHIIHCAWPVNFQLALSAFETSLKGLQNLLRLSLRASGKVPARFLFCSSISAAFGIPPPARIPEAPIDTIENVSLTGYAQSKLVSEHIVQAAVETAGADAFILRIGQVVGDTKWAVWNDSEAFPLIIRSALTMGILPELQSTCEWLPVDTLAESIIQIASLDSLIKPLTNGAHQTSAHKRLKVDRASVQGRLRLVYNLVSPHSFSWTSDLLPALSSAGLSFRPKSMATWTHQLRQLSSAQPLNNSNGDRITGSPAAAADPNLNPAIKLVEFFEEFETPGETGDPGIQFGETGIRFETEETEKRAPALREAPSIIESGLLKKMVDVWMAKWKAEVSRWKEENGSSENDKNLG